MINITTSDLIDQLEAWYFQGVDDVTAWTSIFNLLRELDNRIKKLEEES